MGQYHMSCIQAAVLLPVAILGCSNLRAQEIAPQKKTVGFLFGTVHPRLKDGSPIKNAAGNPVAIEQPLGTAFFVSYPDSRLPPKVSFSYLVTAKHVLKDADGSYLPKVKLRLNLRGDAGAEFIEDIPVTDDAGKLAWLSHQDGAVDVAMLPFIANEGKFDCMRIPTSMFVDSDAMAKESIAEGDPLYFIGLMTPYYGNQRNHPVVRRGSLALMTEEKIETPTGLQNAFIAELVSWPGNSGSPVLLNLGGMRGNKIYAGSRVMFLGILAGSFLNRFKATMLDTAIVMAGDGVNIGISYIIPASRVKEVLETPQAKSQRDAEVENFLKPKPEETPTRSQ